MQTNLNAKISSVSGVQHGYRDVADDRPAERLRANARVIAAAQAMFQQLLQESNERQHRGVGTGYGFLDTLISNANTVHQQLNTLK